MNYGKLLAWAVILLSAGASIGYFLARDYRKGFYWLFATAIQLTVTL
jgi:hypothetical protein